MEDHDKRGGAVEDDSVHGNGTANEDLCFVIMPFGGWFDEYYREIYCPAIEATGLSPCRVDDLYRPSAIVRDIWFYTKKAKIVLADLTGKNPNVFYELGLAHAIAKPAILVTESMDDIPFDLQALRVIEYDKNAPLWSGILRDKIENSIKEIIQTPLQAVLPTFLTVRDEENSTSVTPYEKEIVRINQELEQIKRYIGGGVRRSDLSGSALENYELRNRVNKITVQAMQEALNLTKGNKTEAANILGISRSRFFELYKEHKEELVQPDLE